jgi:hypothetical protein
VNALVEREALNMVVVLDRFLLGIEGYEPVQPGQAGQSQVTILAHVHSPVERKNAVCIKNVCVTCSIPLMLLLSHLTTNDGCSGQS